MLFSFETTKCLQSTQNMIPVLPWAFLHSMQFYVITEYAATRADNINILLEPRGSLNDIVHRILGLYFLQVNLNEDCIEISLPTIIPLLLKYRLNKCYQYWLIPEAYKGRSCCYIWNLLWYVGYNDEWSFTGINFVLRCWRRWRG